ncbi:MAG: hypothetical protein P1P84_11645 [Deferrisomatales bacterium]|nr:hypothetical protein [Deferrisomatales bacterium]
MKMKTCDKCGVPVGEPGSATPSGLEILEDVASAVTGDKSMSLCERCREEKRLTGAALVYGMCDFGEH